MQIQGYDIETLGPLLQPRDKWTINEQGIACTRTVLALYANWWETVPTLYDPHPINTGVQYRSAECTQETEFGELCLVTLHYDQRYGVPTTGLPQSQHGVNASKLVQDITLHPNFNGGPGSFGPDLPWSQFWDATKKDWQSDASGKYLASVPAYLIGWNKYPDAAATVWTKVYFESEPTSPLPEGLIVDPGFGYGPSGCYKVDTCDRAKENAFWYQMTHFEYYPNGVPTQIFQHG